MMTTGEVRDWLKTQVESPAWYIGKLDGKQPQCIGVYNLNAGSPVIALGGLEQTSYAVKGVSILVHWGKNANIAERKAHEVYAALFGQVAEIGGRRVISFDMRVPEPVNVGTDDDGIYEYVIETIIYYER
ncbi:hypothetical protein SAMN04487969_101128 [Paenibacillus algorifonticola]|uniref:DUF3168 domain-containing protein n=1 Tax=Paenibacillus algorifonticola TaxID=684063 RepID=A0A1I1Y066_9BACL|nr:minor capsid protein [Paenibacillus algorifonticola]SFE11463.1 hypothetical protein SAMN04487969_101128 [Paenibacillus algorifonticola]